MKRLYILSCVIILSTSLVMCKKENPEYRLQGRIVNARTNIGINDATVKVQKQVVNHNTFSAVYTLAASAQTDGSGYYKLSWPRENFVALKIESEYAQYIPKEIELNVENFEANHEQNKTIALYPEAFINVSVSHSQLGSSTDMTKFNFVNANFDCQCCNSEVKQFSGIVDTNFTCKLYGDQWLKYKWTYRLSGQDTVVVDSIWCTAFEITQIHLNY